MLDVTIVTPQEVLFHAKASYCIFPGELGVFEVRRFHRPVISRLLPGYLIVDDKPFPILRGVVQVVNDMVTALVESGSA